MLQHPTYADFRLSGIDWLGAIPSHWKTMALHYLGRLRSGDAITALQFDETGKYPVFGGNGLRGYCDRFTHDGERILIGRQGALCGNINIATGKFFASEHAIVVIPERLFNTSWLGYQLESMNLNQYSVSAAQPGLSSEAIGRLIVSFPTIEEQNSIARFLNFKTAKIDALIAKKKALLEKLAEQRTALISHAVTKGLDPAAPMKDSGLAWLGEIPAHWQRMLMARVIRKFEQGWSPSCEEREASLDEWGVLKSGCVNLGKFQASEHKTLPSSLEPISSLEVKAGDILMCRASGSRHLIGSVAMVEHCRPKLMPPASE